MCRNSYETGRRGEGFVLGTDRAMAEVQLLVVLVLVQGRRGYWVLMEVDCFVDAGYTLGQIGVYGTP